MLSYAYPIRASGLKTNYIQQIKELYQLLEMGAINESDFAAQKIKILCDSMGYLGPHVELNLD